MKEINKSVQYKVVIGYVILFLIAAISVGFVYTKVLYVAESKEDVTEQNNKLLAVSNAITTLYESEILERRYIVTGSDEVKKQYLSALDSVSNSIFFIKRYIANNQSEKLDSISYLIESKKVKIDAIVELRKRYNKESDVNLAIKRIYNVKDSLSRSVTPVKFKKSNQINNFLRDFLPKKTVDSLSRLPISEKEIMKSFEIIISNLMIKDNKIKYELFKKEQDLLDENQLISDKLRLLFTYFEQQIFDKSYQKILNTEKDIKQTTQTILLIGLVAVFLIVFLGYLVINDLKRQQKYREQLERLNQENESLIRSKTMLMATVTHDVQTPLNTILGFTSLLKDTSLNDKQKEYIQNLNLSSDYLLRLVNDLVDFTKLENNKLTINKSNFNIKYLLEDTCRPLKHLAVNKNINFLWEISEELNIKVSSDQYRIKQVLTNLVTNAIKFTQKGYVKVSAYLDNNMIHIDVLDTGIGITQEQQELIFNEFTQAHFGIEKQFGGTGLGLTISKKIIELLGGKISVSSTINEGSVFTIQFPLLLADDVATDEIKPNVQYNFIGKKFLVIDDDAIQLALIKEILEKNNATVFTTDDANVGLQIVETESIDLVFTDIQMPKITGFEFLEMIRSNSNKDISNVVVVALSGKKDLNLDDFQQKGFDYFISKPVSVDGLKSIAAALINKETTQINYPNQVPENKFDGLYSLEGINMFLDDDKVAINKIIQAFINETKNNINELQMAIENKNVDLLSDIAHKMLPMLRQLSVCKVVAILEPIESKSIDIKEVITLKNMLFNMLNELIEELEVEVNR